MDFSFIFVGGTHGFVDDFKKQKEIILSAMPEFVLCEDLEDNVLDSKEKLKEIINKKEISNMTSFEDVERLAKLCFDKGIKLIGIDFKNFGFDDNLQRKIKNHEVLTKEEEEKLSEIVESREKNHLSKLLEYQKKTSKPLVVILGCWHLREDSLLRKNLRNYKIIAPVDENGRILFEPNKSGEIKYGEITSNDSEIKN